MVRSLGDSRCLQPRERLRIHKSRRERSVQDANNKVPNKVQSPYSNFQRAVWLFVFLNLIWNNLLFVSWIFPRSIFCADCASGITNIGRWFLDTCVQGNQDFACHPIFLPHCFLCVNADKLLPTPSCEPRGREQTKRFVPLMCSL